MKTNPTPNYDYGALTAPLPFVVGPQDVLPSNTKKKNNKVNMKKAGKARNPSNIGVPALIVKTYKLPLDLVRQVESVAYWRRKKIQDVMAEALTMFLDTIPTEDRQSIPGQ
jgi:hypothetical protein